MVNRWRIDSVGLAGVDNTDKDKNDKENSNEPKEEVATTRRPQDSKNKPKPSIFEIADTLLHFAGRRQRGVCILSATGTVANVTLRQNTEAGAVMALHDRFEIISLIGSFLPGPSPSWLNRFNRLPLWRSGTSRQRRVVGPLVASGPVMVMVVTFSNAAYERLPLPH